jgi:hypothetical protein
MKKGDIVRTVGKAYVWRGANICHSYIYPYM